MNRITIMPIRSIYHALFVVLVFSCTPLIGQENDLPAAIRAGLNSDNVDRQKAMLALIPEVKLRFEDRRLVWTILDQYLSQQKITDECRMRALMTYSKTQPPALPAAAIFKNNMNSPKIEIRRATADALASYINLTNPNWPKALRDNIRTSPTPEALGAITGMPYSVWAVRLWLENQKNENVAYAQYIESVRLLSLLCGQAMREADEPTRVFGTVGIRELSNNLNVLLEPLPTGSELKTFDPFEGTFKTVLFFKPLCDITQQTTHLIPIMQSTDERSRLAAADAAEAYLKMRDKALAGLKGASDTLNVLDPQYKYNPVLQDCLAEILPPLAVLLKDKALVVRLKAAEAFENVGYDGHTQLPALLATANDPSTFVRWVATRCLGKMLLDANPKEASQIVPILSNHVGDRELDIANAAMMALAKGGNKSMAATDQMIRRQQ